MNTAKTPNWEICILAGGLSQRMRCDKSQLKLGPRTLLNHIRAEARSLGRPVRVIRRDVVPRCGPLGGVFTALKSTRAEVVLFLACDMPWLSAGLLRTVIGRFRPTDRALFVRSARAAGFPFALRVNTLATVAEQIGRCEFSVQALARVLKASILRPPHSLRSQLQNVNTPEEWRRTQQQWQRLARPPGRKIV